ncbi:hypothetical protein ACJ72_03193 [Emergomyces africanus]|uniref:Aldehyde dehydrogenase domain-containing protein n=1 Tax=Emergomyces africanus TaxID=1955775 RepID=A0A1B7P0B0_9EURO|nr:hypothetical protein ACJ72_03193 [Emergomyces africanus]
MNWGLGLSLLKDVAGRSLSSGGIVPILREDGQSGVVYKELFGVILSIAHWNAMFILGLRSVVLPLAAASAADITTVLIAHPAVRKINFTGSTQVGKIIASTAGKYIKPVLLELGGKASAPVQSAAKSACPPSASSSNDQSFASSATTSARPWPPTTPNPEPVLVNSPLVNKNTDLVTNAVSKGAIVAIGDINRVPEGTHMRPVVLENVTPAMDIYQTESFGPIVSLFVVDTKEEAIQLANDTEYGLSAAVYTENLGRGLRVARQLESGAVHINSMTVHDKPNLPHGGVKCSGFGRFGGPTGLDEFLTTKSVTWMDV